MDKYAYSGPIVVFDKCVSNNWKGETWADSQAKAMSNLAYQAKKACNILPGSRVTLPGELKIIG